MPARHSFCERFLALGLALLVLVSGACLPAPALDPYPGVSEIGRLNLVAVPGGHVNTAGGNLLLARVDLSLDTPLGTQEIRAVYNSASGRWLWNFQMSYDGTQLVDATGLVHADNDLPRTVRLDPEQWDSGCRQIAWIDETLGHEPVKRCPHGRKRLGRRGDADRGLR